MRKKVLAVFPLLSAIMVLVGLWIANALTTPPWRAALNLYIAYKTSPPASLITLERAVQAGQPWRFRADMSGATYGDCYYFDVSYCDTIKQALPDPPLPFPPEDLWCALLQSTASDRVDRWVVYIARHEDLYNAGWIVHESPRSLSDSRLSDDLASIGCSAVLNTPR
jgi:hypothetical protein